MRRKWLVPLLLLALLTLCFLWGVTGYPPPGPAPVGGSPGGPSAAHWLGTDNLGVDIYAQISAGFFRSLGIGLAAAAFTFAVGGGLGILAGFVGGWADALISFLIQVLLAIPQLPVMIVIGAFLGQSTWNLVWIIAAFSWAPVARQMRAKTISIRRRDYVQMARLYGGGTWYLIRTHIGHELWPLLTINALAVVGRAILQESLPGLSGPVRPAGPLLGYDDRPGRGLPRSLSDGLLDVVAPSRRWGRWCCPRCCCACWWAGWRNNRGGTNRAAGNEQPVGVLPGVHPSTR